ncbi:MULTISPECIES: phosphatase PAP2 family protein [Salinivibrio]|uniref:undecaprenyl-diphosphate phosphatase n=1 Tax=Salinivibrio costicola subsp. alcaliphilus TaxID=272773 RepID=A0ABX3KUG9_SALCS|nr:MULTISPECIES: phosphatase PAP2 family protein [Salinivibrio]NUY55645.1 phosphatase PAP2 family protein [Salinivibrio sp. EAGSL]OOE94032.1 phosphatase PAP2 family protein [Salinivibrio sp. AR640]OOE94439.1 phosphatase PAP2 family protein [Salinivibrio sp. AR647]OOF34632.1 phosphatase PAP2 family protein [Salinivibrio costicola subsp. alcaliphilus]
MRRFAAIQRFDHSVSTLCLSHRFSADTAKVARAVSHSGDGPLYIVVGLAAWWLQEAVGLWFLLTGLTAFAIELPIYWVLKRSFRRTRPSQLPAFITPSDLYSMPSGHTAGAFLMASLLSIFFPSLTLFVFIWASLIGISRVLLGVHFVTDIIVGAGLGIMCANLAHSITADLYGMAGLS